MLGERPLSPDLRHAPLDKTESTARGLWTRPAVKRRRDDGSVPVAKRRAATRSTEKKRKRRLSEAIGRVVDHTRTGDGQLQNIPYDNRPPRPDLVSDHVQKFLPDEMWTLSLYKELESDRREALLELVRNTKERVASAELANANAAGGTYKLLAKDQTALAIFKPRDEEPGAHNNPRKVVEKPLGDLEEGVGCLREVMAYVLDREGFAGVPPTAFFKLPRRFLPATPNDDLDAEHKTGSLQFFVEGSAPMDEATAPPGDAPPPRSSAFTVEDVQRIAILDIRLLNADRNEGNIMVRWDDAQHKWKLIPIDHAFTLPLTTSEQYYTWRTWPQVKSPLGYHERAYIEKLDVEADADLLARFGFADVAVDLFRASGLLLKAAVARGATLAAIAEFQRPRRDGVSFFGALLRACERVSTGGDRKTVDLAAFASAINAIEWADFDVDRYLTVEWSSFVKNAGGKPTPPSASGDTPAAVAPEDVDRATAGVGSTDAAPRSP